MKEEIDDYDEHPEDDLTEKSDDAVFGSAKFKFNFGEGEEVPTAVFLVAGLIIVGGCAALFNYTEGFGVTDEWNSKDWVSVDANVDRDSHYINQIRYHTYAYNYTVDGIEYDGEWKCSEEGSPNCFLHYSSYTFHKVSYNPDDHSESDFHPGFTRQIFWESVHWLGVIGLFTLIGLLLFSTGVGKMLGISMPIHMDEDDDDDDDDKEHDDPAAPRESDFLP
jgi:hypothetical protein